MSYTVVEFPMEKKGESTAMEIIPTNWLCETEGKTFCWFPSKYKKAQFEAAVNNQEEPDASYVKYLIKILYKKGSMKKCKSKLEKFTMESELASITETESDNNYPTSKKPKGYEKSSAVQSHDNNIEDISEDMNNDFDKFVTDLTTNNNDTDDTNIITEKFLSATTSDNNTQRKRKIEHLDNHKFKIALMKWMIRIENNQREIKASIETLKLGYDKVSSSRNTILTKLGLPASSVETLLNVNTMLEDKENFNDLVNILKAQGGGNLSELCSRMMATILTDECGTQLVWVGRLEEAKPDSKKSFKKTLINIYAVLLDAAAVADKWNSTIKTIEITFGNWLIKAKTRKERAVAKKK